MNAAARPAFVAVDHVSWTVPDLEAAIAFYTETFGATVLYRIGPIDSADIPKDEQGRDWMETHVGVKGARLTLAMLQLAGGAYAEAGEHACRALERVAIPGRFQRCGKVIFDVAHNPAGISVLCEALDAVGVSHPLTCLLTVLADKDWRTMISLLATRVDRFVLTAPPSARRRRTARPSRRPRRPRVGTRRRGCLRSGARVGCRVGAGLRPRARALPRERRGDAHHRLLPHRGRRHGALAGISAVRIDCLDVHRRTPGFPRLLSH